MTIQINLPKQTYASARHGRACSRRSRLKPAQNVAEFVSKANPSSFLVQVKQNSATLCRDPTQSVVKLCAAVATRRAQNIALEALRVHAHQDVLSVSDLTAHEGYVCLLVDLILECMKAKLSVSGWQLRRGYALYDRLPTHPVCDQVCDGDQRRR